MTSSPIDLLRSRVRGGGGEPLLTYYDLDSGERTELSARSLANWVDKTSNLLADELDVTAGDPVALHLAHTHPIHWVTAVWELACWQLGAAVEVVGATADVAVAGPDGRLAGGSTRHLVICSLHPFGLPLPIRPDPPALDYTLEVRGQPDVFVGAPPPQTTPAWRDPEQTFTLGELVVAAGTAAGRVLLRPTTPWRAAAAVIAALAGDGSVVATAGVGTGEQLTRIRVQERVSD